MFYSGIDLHKDMSFITTINEKGSIVAQKKLPNHNAHLLGYFDSIGHEHKAVVESTANWYWLSDLLNDHGIELTLAHAKYLKAISYAKVKTDKVDSHTLANLLRLDMVPQAHQINPDMRPIRDLMRARLSLVRKKTSCINSIHRLLAKYNLILPNNSKSEDVNRFRKQLGPEPQLQLKILQDQLQLIRNQITDLEKSLTPKLIPNPDIQRLLYIPGIGKILAFTIYLEVDGIDRFSNVNRFYSYCRLVPGASNSNKVVKHTSNKDGNKYLKMAFMEASVRAVQYFKEVKSFHQSKARKKHKNIAKALVAQEIAKITYHVLKSQTDFNHMFKGIPLSRHKTTKWPRLASPGA